MLRSRTRHQLRIGLPQLALRALALAVVVVSTGCSISAEERAEIEAIGQAQLERHSDNEIVLPLQLDGLTNTDETILPAAVGETFGGLPDMASRTTYRYVYFIDPELSLDDALDNAVAFYQQFGARLLLSNDGQRTLLATSRGDDLRIEVIARDGVGAHNDTFSDVVTITSLR